MKKYLSLALMFCAYSHAHEPYVAPLSYVTTNTQIPVISGYAEEALNSEHALKQLNFTVIQPDNSQLTIQSIDTAQSASIFNLPLKDKGTYRIFAKTSFPLKYVQHNKEWKMLFDVPADKAEPINEREYVVPSDFKKAPIPVEITREWSLQSYVSKNETSAVNTITKSPIQVAFKTHPNNIHALEPVEISITQSGQPLKQAEVLIRAQGTTDKQAQHVQVKQDGTATLSFPHSGQYLIEVSETVNKTARPRNQYYTIISLDILPTTTK